MSKRSPALKVRGPLDPIVDRTQFGTPNTVGGFGDGALNCGFDGGTNAGQGSDSFDGGTNASQGTEVADFLLICNSA